MIRLDIPPRHRGGVWVFSVDLPDHALEYFRTDHGDDATGTHDYPLAEALGLNWIDPDQVELFDANMMQDYGLMRYLSEANGMDPATMNPADAPVDALSGPVLLVFAGALPEEATAMVPRAPLTFVAHLSADQPLPDLRPLPDGGTQGHIADGAATVGTGTQGGAMRGWVLPLLVIAAGALAGLILWGMT